MRGLKWNAILIAGLFLPFLFASSTTALAQSWANGYAHRLTITINHTKVPNTDQTNFPVLLSGTYPYLAMTANGGQVTNANGYDIIFTSDAAGTVSLPYERESYNSATGAIIFWLQIPTLSHTTDTVIYMFCGNSVVTTDQSNRTAVWDSNYQGVWHLDDNAASSTVAQSTGNSGETGTAQANTNTKSVSGQIGSGLTFNGSTDWVDIGSAQNLYDSTFTVSLWMKTGDTNTYRRILEEGTSGNGYHGGYDIEWNGDTNACNATSRAYGVVWTTSSLEKICPTSTPSSGTWHYAVLVSSPGATQYFYIDGVQYSSSAFTTSAPSIYDFVIGGSGDSSTRNPINGQIDEVRMSNSARSADWIATEYNNQSSPSTFYSIDPADWSNGYSYRRSITIDHTKVSNTDQVNFPFLVSGAYSYLATTSNGGQVTNANGYDIIFTSDARGCIPLPYERESYNLSTGAINFWVGVPTVSHTTDTVIYMFYGNSSVTADQSNKTGAWDSNYVLVGHLSDNAGNTTVQDSTLNANTGTNSANTSTESVSGEIGNALAYARTSGATTTFADSSSLEVTSAVSLEAWIKSSDTAGSNLWRSYQNSSPYSGYGVGYGVITPGKMSYWSSSHSSWVTANSTVNDGAWHHVAVTVSSVGGVSFYRDGVADGTQTSNVPALYTGGKAIADGGFTGTLDEIRISKTTRSADWIATEYMNQSAPSTFYTIGSSVPAPNLTNLSPTSGATGTSVTITGANFGSTQGSSTVTFNGVTATPTSWSSTQIVVPVPSGTVSGNVVVTVSSLPSNGLVFTDTSASIIELLPAWGPISTPVTILGANFGSTQGASVVSFNGVIGTPTSWSNSQIVVPVPNGTSSGNVVVTVANGSTNAAPFTVTVPTISALSPSLGPTGTSVAITGSSFGLTQSQGSSTVTFNGVAATPTSWSSTTIVIPVPSAATTGNVVVTVARVSSSGVNFAVVPNLTSLSPLSGLAGTLVTITGTGFGATQGTSTVTFNGTASTAISWANTSITVAVPNGATAGNVVVTVGGNASNGQYFTVLPTGWLDQDIGAVGVTGSASYSSGTFTVNGAGGMNSTSDAFHFVYQPLSGDGTIVARLTGSHSSQSPAVGLMIRETLASNSTYASLDYIPNQFYLDYRTSTGGGMGYQSTSGGPSAPYWIKVTRTGNSFASYWSQNGLDWTQVGTGVTISMATNVYIGLFVDSASSGTLETATFDSVSVNTSSNPAPVIAGVSATTGPVGGQVVITGSNFGASQIGSEVTLNGAPVTVNAWSDTSITITIPPGATSGLLEALVGPSLDASNAVYFTLTSQPLPSGWLDQDVGVPGVIGSATYSNGTFTMNGAGGLTNSGDAFHFAYQHLSGDGTIVARVVASPSTTYAGLMIRESMAANATFAALGYLPNEFNLWYRTGTGGGVGDVASPPQVGAPYWLKLTRSGNSFTGYGSQDEVTWTQIGSSVTIAMAANAYVGLAVDGATTFDNVSINSTGTPAPVISGVSTTTGAIGSQVVITGSHFGLSQNGSQVILNQLPMTINSWADTSITITIVSGSASGFLEVLVAPSMNASNPVIFTVTSQPLPSGWLDQDVGSVGTTGSATYSSAGGTFTVNGSGNGIGGTADSFQFVYQTLSGDGAIVARLVTLEGGSGYHSAGLMIRETLAAGATEASVNYANNSGGYYLFSFADRTTTGGNSSNQTSPLTSLPYWLRLTRSGNTFTAYMSPDGVYWTPVGTSVTIAMATSVYIGMEVTGASTTQLATATFDNVALSSGAPSPWPNITSISPTYGGIGASVTVNGTGFGAVQGSSSVLFNGSPATSISSWGNTQIVAIVPSTASTGPLTVLENGLGSNKNNIFTLYHPVISSLTPPAAPVGGSVVISGSGFGSSQGNGGVSFNGLNGYIWSWSDTSITAIVPNNATSGPVTVTEGGVASAGVQFTVLEPTTISGISPSFGPIGSSVVITGTGFGPTQSSSLVHFLGETAITITSWSDTSITAVVPAGMTTGRVWVSVAGNTVAGPVFTLTARTHTTDSLGNTSYYDSVTVGAQWVSLDSQGPGCSTCSIRGNTQSTYDANGNVLTATDPAGHTTTYTYDASNNMLSQSVQLDSSHTATTSYTYNAISEVLTVTDPLGNVTTNTYDNNGNLITVTSPKPNSSTAASVTQFGYDSKGELTTITDPLNHVTTMTYTTAGLVATIKDAQNNVTTYGYDLKGNRTSVTDALNHQTTFTYDAMSRLTKITYRDSTTTSFTYDVRGRRTSVTDQNNKTTSYAYDDADRLTSVTDAASHVTYYAYDTEDNLTSITDAKSNQTAFTYDAFGRVTKTTFPSALAETYQYDADNNLTQKIDRKNQTITYLYDALNRLTQKTYPDTTNVDYTYDLVGKVLQVNDPTGTYAFAYDNMGRLIGTTTSYSFLTSRNFTTSYAYDAASNRTGFTDPEGGSTTYSYDTLNRLTSLAPPSAFGSGSFGFSYDALSRRTQMTRPNSVTTNYNYDNLSRLTSVLHQLSGSTIDGATYTVDNAGNRLSKTDNRTGIMSNYTYDPIYELTQVTQGANTTESYSYDAVGNRTASLGVSSYATNASNELTATSNATYAYDSNGNTLTKTDSTGTTSYAWDFENRLASVTLPGTGGTVSFKYDPLGRRIEKTSSSTSSIYAYDGDNLIEETNSTGAVVARYSQTTDIDEPLAMLRSSATSYYNADGLGSITSLASSSGALAQTYTFDSFGKQTGSSGSLTNPFQYTARELDSETGFYFNRARYYDPQTGRFASEDPLRWESGLDFYPYVDNEPTLLIDPFGLYKCVGRAVCNFTPDMNKALNDLEKCLKHEVTITCGRDSHGPNDPHMKGLAVDLTYVANPWLTRDQIVKCFNSVFPRTAYAQQEWNNDDPKPWEYHYHLQYIPGKGGASGFSQRTHEHGH